jgi:hypothetical protein
MSIDSKLVKRFKLTNEQIEIYAWLKGLNINTDDGTLIYWAKTYPSQRLKDIVNFAISRRNAGQDIRNIGGWVKQFLKNGLPVVTGPSEHNKGYTEEYCKLRNWNELKIYEKYVKDAVTGDDLSFLMENEEFKRALESLYIKSQLYG